MQVDSITRNLDGTINGVVVIENTIFDIHICGDGVAYKCVRNDNFSELMSIPKAFESMNKFIEMNHLRINKSEETLSRIVNHP